jgi:hypothetical protein
MPLHCSGIFFMASTGLANTNNRCPSQFTCNNEHFVFNYKFIGAYAWV